MNTTARRLTGLGIASAAVTFALAAPASAMPIPPDPQPNFNGLHGDVGGGGSSSPVTVVSEGTDWAQIGYGAAGGIALAAAGAVGIVLVRRHQHLPHHA